MRLPCEVPPPDAHGIVQGGGGLCAHVHVGVMVVGQAAQAAIPGGCAGGRGRRCVTSRRREVSLMS